MLAFTLYPAAQAQQVQIDERTKTPYEYKAYRDATITMMFGSKKQVKGNIYLDGSKFYFMQGNKPIEASLHNINRIQFGDTVYMPVDTMAARIVAQKGNNMLVCIKTIDRQRMTGRNDGKEGSDKRGEGMAYFQLDMLSAMGFMELNNMEEEKKALTFPLKREYYYFLDGQKVPAKEGPVMKRYNKHKENRCASLPRTGAGAGKTRIHSNNCWNSFNGAWSYMPPEIPAREEQNAGL